MFEEVNEAINEVFLGGRFESRPLYLVLDARGREQLSRLLADTLGSSPETVEENFCAAIGQTLAATGDPYQDIEFEYFSWRVGGRKTAPPFTALLFVLSRAAELMVSDGQFSAANYYERLAALTGVEKWRLSQFGCTTEQFWRAFNKWLADTDFVYGRPTARAVNSYRYVGLAMSQAIVREEDRKRFHDLFEKYRFSGTDAVTEEEISQYIANWIHSSRPTKQLKAAWAKAELRPRICEAAIAELGEWADETERGDRSRGGSGGTRLSMAMSFRHDLFKRSVSTWLGREAEVEPVRLEAAGTRLQCTLDNTTFAGFATIEPRAELAFPEILGQGLQLRDSLGRAYEWSARPVVPLARSEKGAYWTEVNRVTMGVEHVVLVRGDRQVRDAVEATLAEIAQPGYTVSTSAELKGLPAGWLLYEKVRALRPLEQDKVNGFHVALSPVGATSGLQVIGGLKIARSIWHAARPPLVVLDTRVPATRLSAWDGVEDDGDELYRQVSDLGQVAFDVASAPPPSGNLFVEGAVGDETIGTATLLLRSARTPRSLDRQGKGAWEHDGALSSRPAASGGTAVVGHAAPEKRLPAAAVDLAEFAVIGMVVPGEEEHGAEPAEEQDEPAAVNARTGLTPSEVVALPCAVRGIHRFRYEMEPKGLSKKAPLNGECQDCGIGIIFRRPGKKPAAAAKKPSASIVPRTHFVPPPSAPLPLDLWLDAACFWGVGTAATFEGLAASEAVEPWQVNQVLKDLSALGHLDLGYSAAMRPRAWSVSPPVLSHVGEELAVLCGFRNDALLEELEDLVTSAGGRVEKHGGPRQPAVVEVAGLDAAAAAAALDVLVDAHGRRVVVVPDAASRLSAFCTAQGGLHSAFAPATLGGGPVEHFDIAAARWRSVEAGSGPGAFRASYAGTTYFYRAASGKTYSGPHELVKLAAGRQAGVHLHAYDEAKRQFVSVLGCEPPGLLGRALVACSGYLPSVEQGMSRYRGVPPDIAGHVLDYLYNGELPS